MMAPSYAVPFIQQRPNNRYAADNLKTPAAGAAAGTARHRPQQGRNRGAILHQSRSTLTARQQNNHLSHNMAQ
jgi:hypothetical protein